MLDFTISGKDGPVSVYTQKFTRLADGMGDMREFEPELTPWFYGMEQGQFQNAGRANRWPDLNEKYEERRSKITPFPFPMHRSGALSLSLTRKGSANSISEADKDALTYGTSLPYAKWHMGPSGNRPARKPIDVQDSDKKEAQRRSAKALRKVVRRTFSGESGLVML